MITLFVCLSVWQINRGLEKMYLEKLLASRSTQYTEISNKPKIWKTLDQQLVTLIGQWLLNQTFLMENRVYQGQLGYEVYSPFQLIGDGTILMVNRGWLSRAASINIQNVLNQNLKKTLSIHGHIYIPEPGFTLGKAVVDQNDWPKMIQYFDPFQIGDELNVPISPAVMVLDSTEPLSLIKIWKPYVLSASRHFGYAAQWFGLAITLLIFGIIWRQKSFI